MFIHPHCRKALFSAFVMAILSIRSMAQTDQDFDMMAKNLFCSGFTYTNSSWTNYWEGTLKRDNLNLGTVRTQMLAYMGNYGLSKKLNLLFGLPYVKTNASAGTMSGLQGIQDLSLFAKYKAFTLKTGKGNFTLLGVGGVSFPLTNYVADHMPLNIGLRSKSLIGRVIADYQQGRFFVTASGTYMLRSNITIDRNSYYTTEMHLTNKVEMPDATNYQARIGYRSKTLTAEGILNRFVTLGGFDITRNNMPFPSNRMNATAAGVGAKFFPQGRLKNFSLNAEFTRTIAGRNVGEASSITAGAFYILNFNKKSDNNQSK